MIITTRIRRPTPVGGGAQKLCHRLGFRPRSLHSGFRCTSVPAFLACFHGFLWHILPTQKHTACHPARPGLPWLPSLACFHGTLVGILVVAESFSSHAQPPQRKKKHTPLTKRHTRRHTARYSAHPGLPWPVFMVRW